MRGSDCLGARRTLFAQHRQAPLLLSVAVLFGYLCIAMFSLTTPSHAQAEAAATNRPPLSVAIFISSRKDLCFDPGDVAAIKRLAIAEQERINATGGILRRRLELQILDDNRLPERTIANVKVALANLRTVAMIGLSNSANAKATFDALGSDIGASGIPFLSDITVNSIFDKHANVFTTRPSQDDERVPVLVQFIKARNVQRPAFVGLKDTLFSSSLGDGLKSLGDGVGLVADHRLTLQNNKLDPAAIATVVADLKQKDTDMVFLAIGSNRTAPVLAAFVAAGLAPPIFVTGRIETILEAGAPEYPGDIFQLAWEDLPDVFNDRLRERIVRNGIEKWVFEGGKIAEAPG